MSADSPFKNALVDGAGSPSCPRAFGMIIAAKDEQEREVNVALPISGYPSDKKNRLRRLWVETGKALLARIGIHTTADVGFVSTGDLVLVRGGKTSFVGQPVSLQGIEITQAPDEKIFITERLDEYGSSRPTNRVKTISGCKTISEKSMALLRERISDEQAVGLVSRLLTAVNNPYDAGIFSNVSVLEIMDGEKKGGYLISCIQERETGFGWVSQPQAWVCHNGQKASASRPITARALGFTP